MLKQLLQLLEQYDTAAQMRHYYAVIKKKKEAATFEKEQARLTTELQNNGVQVIEVEKDYFVIKVSRYAKEPTAGRHPVGDRDPDRPQPYPHQMPEASRRLEFACGLS